MNAKTWFLLIVALICGAGASFGVKSIFFVERDAQSADEAEETLGPKTQTLVANADLPAGTELTASNVRLDLIPESRVSRDAILSFDGLSGRKTANDIKKGAPISLYDLADLEKTPEEDASFVPPGYAVVPVEIQAATNAKGGRNYLRSTNLEQMLAPGDRVDLAVVKEDESFKSGSDGSFAAKARRLTTQTIVENVPVFAVADDSHFVEETGETKRTSTLSVLLSAEQLKLVQSASEEGKIKVVERNAVEEAEPGDASDFRLNWGVSGGESAVAVDSNANAKGVDANGARSGKRSDKRSGKLGSAFDADAALFAIPTNESFVFDADFAEEPRRETSVDSTLDADEPSERNAEIADEPFELPADADSGAAGFAIDESVLDADAFASSDANSTATAAGADETPEQTVGFGDPIPETFEEGEKAVDLGSFADATRSTVRVFRPRFPEGADKAENAGTSESIELPNGDEPVLVLTPGAESDDTAANENGEPAETSAEKSVDARGENAEDVENKPKKGDRAPVAENAPAKGTVEIKSGSETPVKTFKPYSPFVLKNSSTPKAKSAKRSERDGARSRDR